MKVVPLLDQTVSQAEFAEMVGLSEARVSQLVSDGTISRGETAAQWLVAYCERLRDQAAGRAGSEVGGLDLVQERAALARSQRISQDLKNAVARGEYAPIGLLADVLGKAASAVVDRFEQIEGALRKSCPDIADEVMGTVLGVVTAARNEWLRSTARMVDQSMDDLLEQQPDDEALETSMGFDPDDDGAWEGGA